MGRISILVTEKPCDVRGPCTNALTLQPPAGGLDTCAWTGALWKSFTAGGCWLCFRSHRSISPSHRASSSSMRLRPPSAPSAGRSSAGVPQSIDSGGDGNNTSHHHMLCPGGGKHLLEDELGPEGTPVPVHHTSTTLMTAASHAALRAEQASFDALGFTASTPTNNRCVLPVCVCVRADAAACVVFVCELGRSCWTMLASQDVSCVALFGLLRAVGCTRRHRSVVGDWEMPSAQSTQNRTRVAPPHRLPFLKRHKWRHPRGPADHAHRPLYLFAPAPRGHAAPPAECQPRCRRACSLPTTVAISSGRALVHSPMPLVDHAVLH